MATKRHKSTCAYCGGSNDGHSAICTRPACLARYWRLQANFHEAQAREDRAKAESLDKEAQREANVSAAEIASGAVTP